MNNLSYIECDGSSEEPGKILAIILGKQFNFYSKGFANVNLRFKESNQYLAQIWSVQILYFCSFNSNVARKPNKA